MGAYKDWGTSWEQRRVFREQFQCVGSGLSTEEPEMRPFGQQGQLLPFARFKIPATFLPGPFLTKRAEARIRIVRARHAQSRQQVTRLAVCASLVRMTVGGLCMFMGELTMFVSCSCVLLSLFVVA